MSRNYKEPNRFGGSNFHIYDTEGELPHVMDGRDNLFAYTEQAKIWCEMFTARPHDMDGFKEPLTGTVIVWDSQERLPIPKPSDN